VASVSAMIVPTSRASAFGSRFWIRWRIRSLISEALSAITRSSLTDQGLGQALQPHPDRTVDDHVLSPDDRAAEQLLVDLDLEVDPAAEPPLERPRDLLRDLGLDGRGRNQRHVDPVFRLGLELVELPRDLRQRGEPIVLGEQPQEALE